MLYIRYRKLRYRISKDTISYVPLYHIVIRYRMFWHTISQHTISYVKTYDIVCSRRYYTISYVRHTISYVGKNPDDQYEYQMIFAMIMISYAYDIISSWYHRCKTWYYTWYHLWYQYQYQMIFAMISYAYDIISSWYHTWLYHSAITIMTSGILYPWTGLGKMVRTGMYQYVPVQHGTGQYKNSQFVHTCMYQYIPVRTFKKSSGFLTNPERVRRDEIRVIHRLCMGYNVTRSNFKTAQV